MFVTIIRVTVSFAAVSNFQSCHYLQTQGHDPEICRRYTWKVMLDYLWLTHKMLPGIILSLLQQLLCVIAVGLEVDVEAVGSLFGCHQFSS